eukprot:NODE_7637_length_429_cov_0.893048.p4 GENE.NODE_7637_length_429_cov_0.893048~~NODE_7637_length_429_cov_0.893048.p4  ORF type:complete len:55 (+),score=5.27 NODE_7637_length_429_cov_0.893048:229-393(+)
MGCTHSPTSAGVGEQAQSRQPAELWLGGLSMRVGRQAVARCALLRRRLPRYLAV